jgi:type IV pilus assembly protein PilC
MMKAGVPLLQAFDIVGRGHCNPSVGKLLIDIKTEVETGSSLGPGVPQDTRCYFDALFCNLVSAGEAAGILDTLLERLAEVQGKDPRHQGQDQGGPVLPGRDHRGGDRGDGGHHDFRDPGVQGPVQELRRGAADADAHRGGHLGLHARLLVLIFGGGGAAIWFFFYSWKRSVTMQRFMDRLALKIPVFGDVLRKAAIARWCRTLSTMFAAGVPLVESLDSVAGSAGNYVYYEATKEDTVGSLDRHEPHHRR